MVDTDDLFDPRTFVTTRGIVLCRVPAAEATPSVQEGCYAKLPAAIYVDMEMFKIDNPEDCACGVAVKNQQGTISASVPDQNNAGATVVKPFDFHDADIQHVEFIVWDIENGVKLRTLDKFNLAPSINVKDYVRTLLIDAASAVDMLAGFYGKVNDFNPADWILNASREVTFICFTTVTSYYERSGDINVCNKEGVADEFGGVPPCSNQGLLDLPDEDYVREHGVHPKRVFQPVQTPQFTYDIAAGSATDGGTNGGGSHPVSWFGSTMTGPGTCQTSADCSRSYHCDLGTNTCQQCIRDSHCAAIVGEVDGLLQPTCVSNHGLRLCQFAIVLGAAPSPNAILPEPLQTCPEQCDGAYCLDGECVHCREPNDCELMFSPSSTYAKICNETLDASTQKAVQKECNYYFLPPQQAKKRDLSTIIGLSSAVGVLVLIIAVIGVIFAVKKYKSSEAYLQRKLDEDANADSTLTGSPLYDDPLNKRSNPMYVEAEA